MGFYSTPSPATASALSAARPSSSMQTSCPPKAGPTSPPWPIALRAVAGFTSVASWWQMAPVRPCAMKPTMSAKCITSSVLSPPVWDAAPTPSSSTGRSSPCRPALPKPIPTFVVGVRVIGGRTRVSLTLARVLPVTSISCARCFTCMPTICFRSANTARGSISGTTERITRNASCSGARSSAKPTAGHRSTSARTSYRKAAGTSGSGWVASNFAG